MKLIEFTSDEYSKLINVLTYFDKNGIVSDLKSYNTKSYKNSTLFLISRKLHTRIIDFFVALDRERRDEKNKDIVNQIVSLCGTYDSFINLFYRIDNASDVESDMEDDSENKINPRYYLNYYDYH